MSFRRESLERLRRPRSQRASSPTNGTGSVFSRGGSLLAAELEEAERLHVERCAAATRGYARCAETTTYSLGDRVYNCSPLCKEHCVDWIGETLMRYWRADDVGWSEPPTVWRAIGAARMRPTGLWFGSDDILMVARAGRKGFGAVSSSGRPVAFPSDAVAVEGDRLFADAVTARAVPRTVCDALRRVPIDRYAGPWYAFAAELDAGVLLDDPGALASMLHILSVDPTDDIRRASAVDTHREYGSVSSLLQYALRSSASQTEDAFDLGLSPSSALQLAQHLVVVEPGHDRDERAVEVRLGAHTDARASGVWTVWMGLPRISATLNVLEEGVQAATERLSALRDALYAFAPALRNQNFRILSTHLLGNGLALAAFDGG